MPSVPFVITLSSLYQWTWRGSGNPEKKHSKSIGFWPSLKTIGVNVVRASSAPKVENIFTNVTAKGVVLFQKPYRYTVKPSFHMIVTLATIGALQNEVERFLRIPVPMTISTKQISRQDLDQT